MGWLLWGAVLVLVPGVSAVAEPAPPTAAADDLDPFAGWSRVHSGELELFTNAEADRGVEILLRLETFREVFRLLSPEVELRSPVPLRIFAFRDGDAYIPYSNRHDRNADRILGQFLRSDNDAFMTLDASPLGDRGVADLSVVYHESVHELIANNFPVVPRWLNEGLAEYYSTLHVADVGGTKDTSVDDSEELPVPSARIGLPHERHLAWLRKNPDLGLREVLAEPELHHGGSRRVGGFYAVSWAFVHYLLSSPEDSAHLGDFLVRLHAGEEPERALPAAFGRSVERLESDLGAYLWLERFDTSTVRLANRIEPSAVEVEPLPRAEIATHLGDLLATIGRREQAAEHYDVALTADSTHAEAWSGLAWLEDRGGSRQEAAVLHRKALALHPRRAATLVRWGRNRLSLGAWEAARQAFADALVLDPDFATARALLGRAHGQPGGDPKIGAQHLERAVLDLNYRDDVVVYLVQILLRNRRPDEAERWIERWLVPFAEGQVVEEVRQDVQHGRELLAVEKAFAAGEVSEGLAALDRAVSSARDPRQRAALEEQLRALQQRYRQ